MSQIQNLLINKILKTTHKLYFNLDSLTLNQQYLLKNYLDKIESGYPVDYILGEIDFCGKNFKIQEGVFIPRWETEWWVNEILKAKKNQVNIFDIEINQTLKSLDLVVEICCGSGVVGLLLSPYFKRVLACDINPIAVNLSLENQKLLNRQNYQVYNSNLFENQDFKSQINLPWILIANLPYVPLEDFENRKKNNIIFEPIEAIFSGEDGLDLFRETLANLEFNKPSLAFFELDPRNIQIASVIAKKYFKKTYIYPDLDNLERLLVCKI